MKKNKFLLVGLLVIIGFAVYAPNLNNGLFWDDNEWIVNNPFVHDLRHIKELFTENILAGFGLNSNYYRPLLLLSFAFNWVLNGAGPFGYHLVSNLFHIGSAILIFLLLTNIFNSHGRIRIAEGQRPEARYSRAAFLAALFWLIHPLNVEAVAYISGRGDPMSVFFILFALYLWTVDPVRGKTPAKGGSSADHALQADRTSNGVDKRHGVSYMALSIISMILAILSRETAILFPALAMVFYTTFLDSRHSRGIRIFASLKTAFVKTIPFWIVSGVYFLLRLTVLNFNNTLNFYSQANEYTEHLSYRLYTFGHALVEYFKLIFVPVGLHMERDLAINTSIFQWPVWLVGIALIALLAWLRFLYRKANFNKSIKGDANNANSMRIMRTNVGDANNANSMRIMRTNVGDANNANWYPNDPNNYSQHSHEIRKLASLDFRIWFFGVGWFFVALGPVSGVVPINAIMYEHWLYLPLIGLVALAGFYIDKLLTFVKGKEWKVVIWVLLIGYLAFFGVASAKRNAAWGDPIDFYEDILKYNPRSVRVINNLGNHYSAKGDLEKAEETYMRATAVKDSIFAQPYYNLGNIHRDKGDLDRAIELYKQAIEIDPNFPFAYQNLAAVYADSGQFDNAIVVLEKLKELKPAEPRLYYNLALLYLAQQKIELVVQNLEDGLKFSKNDPEAESAIKYLLNNLGN